MEGVAEPPAILPLVADPHRWQLLAELARSDRRVGELTDLLGKPQNLVSYHLGELRKAGVVVSRRSSADRRDVYYHADLIRCRDLLGAASAGIHPGIRLQPVSPGDRPVARRPRPRVLFLCTGNSARSQMAEALVEHRSAGAVSARSAGSHPKALHPLAVRAMAECGIDIAGNATKHLGRFVQMRFDRVITLCDKVREICPEFPAATESSHWSMPDPAAESGDEGAPYAAFRRTAEELEQRISLLLAELTTRPTERTAHAG